MKFDRWIGWVENHLDRIVGSLGCGIVILALLALSLVTAAALIIEGLSH